MELVKIFINYFLSPIFAAIGSLCSILGFIYLLYSILKNIFRPKLNPKLVNSMSENGIDPPIDESDAQAEKLNNKYKKIKQILNKQGSIAIRMKGVKPSGKIIDVIPNTTNGSNKLRVFIDVDGKFKFFIETSEIKHTLEVERLEEYFVLNRYHLILLQWSRDFMAIQIDGQVLAKIEKTK